MKSRSRFSAVPIALLLIFMLVFSGCALQPLPEKTVHVVFRFDDYSAVSATDLERQIIGLFQRYRAPISFAVIPFICAGDIHDPAPQATIPLDSRKIDLLKRAHDSGIVDIGLHGYSHQTAFADHYAEFEGLDFESQVERLRKGKQYLETRLGVPVETFMPPWNRYDRNTLSALEATGFTTLSADVNGIATAASSLSLLPANCSLSQLRGAIASARREAGRPPAIVVLFHEYDFKEIDEKRGRYTFQRFSALVDWLGRQPDVRLMSIRQAAIGP